MGTTNIPNLYQCFENSNKLIIYHNGNLHTCNQNEQDAIVNSLKAMLYNSHEMPAFGVSLDTETRQELNNGTWIEFCFDTVTTYNDMPFDKLLIKVSPDDAGFNIIRHHDGMYEGRCYYISLEKNMEILADTISNIIE